MPAPSDASAAAADSPLPTGTLTLLFSDIEGSTSLLSRLGERYAEVVSAQRRILRSAFQRHQGRELGTEGDSFFVVFERAADAVGAALEAQRGLSRHAWPGGAVVRVRMGLHTGEPMRHEDGYVGMDVHRAARIASSAHGGQVVLSEVTRREATGPALDEVAFVDLGWHRLKDLPQPERLYQLAADGLGGQFPPLKSLGARSNLPTPVTAIVGRDRELRDLHALVASEQARLVTLTGPGGTGKTRLGIAAAALLAGGFPDGVYFVALESARSPEVMWTTLADALGTTGEGRVPTTLLDHLRDRRVLVVLDNLEQIRGAAAVVEELLTAPGLSMIATSRRPLHLPGEHEYPVPPLALPVGDPQDAGAAADTGAVALFVQRARMVRPGFALDDDNTADVTEICRRLDGLPLAIELAAARIKLLSPRALRGRLEEGLALGDRQARRPTRQQTLRDTVAWSYDLLPTQQQEFFRQLGVFRGAFDLAAVAAVARPDGDPLDWVAGLVDVSLATVSDGRDGEPRVRLLQTIAAHALERLAEAGELDAARRRHALHYVELIEAVAPQLRSSHYVSARDRIEDELDNLRAALDWALADPHPEGPPSAERTVVGLRLCQALSWFWYVGGYQSEGRRWLMRATDSAAGRGTRESMIALHGLAVLLLQQGAQAQAREALETCLAFWRSKGDLGQVAVELNSLAVAHRVAGDRDLARAMFVECIGLARGIGEKGRLANALSNLAILEVDAGMPDRAVELLQEAAALDRELGDRWGEGAGQVNLVGAMLRAGRVQEAREHLRAHGPAVVALGDVEMTIDVVELFAMALAELGHAEAAARLAGAAEAMRAKAELPITAPDAALREQSISKVRGLPDAATWGRNLRIGSAYSVDDALADAMGEHDLAR